MFCPTHLPSTNLIVKCLDWGANVGGRSIYWAPSFWVYTTIGPRFDTLEGQKKSERLHIFSQPHLPHMFDTFGANLRQIYDIIPIFPPSKHTNPPLTLLNKFRSPPYGWATNIHLWASTLEKCVCVRRALFGALLSPQWSVVLLAQWIHAWSYSIHVVWCIMHVFPAWLPCPSSGLPCSSDCSKSLMAWAQTRTLKKRDREGGRGSYF
jgi:hypothetical protein